MRRRTVALAAVLYAACASAGASAPVEGMRPSTDATDKLYVVNQGGATISVIDQQKLAVDTVLDLRALGFSANAKPHHVAVEPDGSFWYVSLIGDGRVLKFDRANRLVGQVQLETPGLLALDPVHDSLYVGRSMTAVNPPRSLGVIARRAFTLVDEHEIVIARPHALAVTHDGRWIHTASLAENRIASVETATGRVVLSTIAGAPRSLVQFALSADGRRMVAGGELSNTLLVFDLTRAPPLQPVAEYPLEGKPWDPRFSTDDRTVFVTLLTRNAVAEVDVAGGAVRRVLEGRLAQPYAMLVRADGRYAFVVNQNTGALAPGQSGHEMHGMAGHTSTDGWLSVIDLRDGALVTTLMLGSGPTGLGAALVSARAPTSTQVPMPPARGVPTLVREVAPFAVLDEAGAAIDEPFLGGFDVPRPQVVDIDGDGDLDLFVQERRGAVMFFENVRGRYEWRSDRFLGLDVGEWYRFADLDGDGLVDLLSESPISLIRAWRNVGTRAAPAFRVVADTLRDGDNRPIAADRQNILNVVDIDCNGRLDLFLGRVTGTIDRFEAVPSPAQDSTPRFTLHTERFEGIEILGNVPGQPSRTEIGGTRHGANTMAFGDMDGDGDVDLFWGDYFEPGLLLIENRSTGCTVPAMQERPRRFPDDSTLLTSGYNAPSVGDVDGDGLQDLVMGVIGGAFTPRRTSIANLHVVRQVSRGRFERVTDRLLRTIDVGSDAMPNLADLDGDGDLDLLVGNRISPESDTTAFVSWFENTGGRTTPAFRARGTLPMRGEFHYAPSVADLDGDGRPDLALGTWRDKVQWWRNTGTAQAPRYELADSALITLTRGSNTTPAFSDLDGDGDMDLVVGEASGQLNLYRNDGSSTAPRFVLVTDTLEGIDVGRRSAPTFVDLDGDGAVELVVGSEDGGLQRWRVVREGAWVRFVRDAAVDAATYTYSAATFGDVDGDGRPDVLVGTPSGGLLWYGTAARGAPASRQASAEPAEMLLWPNGAPDPRPGVGPEAIHFATNEASKTRKLVGGKPYVYIENVTRPTITVYSPTAGKNRAAVVVFPGGGFNVLAMDIEGTEVCDWLIAQGVTCVLLKYRVPCKHVGAYRDCPSAHQDAQRAMRIVRSRASEWDIDPRRIGVLGFSAGAHMAIMSSTRFERSYKAVDAADSTSSRPDFALVLYPGRMAYRHSGFKPNPDIRVTAETPPTFLMHARDDKTNAVENSLLYAEALRKAGVAADVHLYEKGGHAFGLRQTGQAASEWPQRAEAWLKRIGMIGRQAK